MKSLYELWVKPPNESTFVPADHKQKAWLTAGATKKWEVEAESWDEAMKLLHEHMDWEPYVPMEG